MHELILTVDTATAAGSVALSRGENLLGEVLLNLPTKHTDRLLVTVRQLLADSGVAVEDLDAFGVTLGPGGFTGLRVGVATVKGLAMATGKPVVGVSSLQTLAMQAPFSSYPVCAMIDARKNEVYAALYQWRGGFPAAVESEGVFPPERFLERLTGETLFIGSGAEAFRTLITRRLGGRAHFMPWSCHLPRAALAAPLVLDSLRQGGGIPLERLAPRYIRLSEAELAWTARQADGAIEG